ncbi:MAG TPA: DNA polymerase III subunit gamma/tau [Burkholderiaceae bacterium]|nr:DNA polymerase III subunit gamma/tau [Burkholderiaceae bacterium]
MTYQVLARKWRPKAFDQLVGQPHVVTALVNALDTGRLHHAYLFTGTRGVGKTTIARILAKALNCETGVTASPCGVCRACTEVDGGRYIDYIEMDAASNRGVDEMTQVLEQAVYAPTAGRYKVYVIDEVHMLSTHAFNAMLKTLEEPPEHVVFVLATTDPEKVPVTVLSRCLQFNLKNMTPAAIAGHLSRVLDAEAIAYEAAALPHIGRAAGGSMRDALSLLDQAISYGGGSVAEGQVREMLGVVDRNWLTRLLDAVLAGDGAALVSLADEMQAGNAPFERTLLDLSGLLQRIALAQVGAFGDDDDPELLRGYAARIAPEELQVYYQVAVHGARDLPLALDAHTGFTMTLLRLLAFRPAGGAQQAAASSPAGGSSGAALVRPVSAARPSAAALAAARSAAVGRPPEASAARSGDAAGSGAPSSPGPAGDTVARRPAGAAPPGDSAGGVPGDSSGVAARAGAGPAGPAGSAEPAEPADAGLQPELAGSVAFDSNWPALAAVLPLGGFARQFMQQSELVAREGSVFRVRVPIRAMAEGPAVGKVREALNAHFGVPVRLLVEVGGVGGDTAAAASQRRESERLAQAEASLQADPFVRTLIDDFGGRIVPDSVRPGENPGPADAAPG